MNDLLTFIYFLGFVAVAGATFAYTWKLMTTTIEDFNKPIKKNIHPEMSDVKSGEELLVFKGIDNDDDDEEDVIIIRK
mgnify:CR=1